MIKTFTLLFFTDPRSYSNTQVRNAKKSILELAQHNVTSVADLNFLSHEVNTLLDVARYYAKNGTRVSQDVSSRDILLAIERVSSNYNASRVSVISGYLLLHRR